MVTDVGGMGSGGRWQVPAAGIGFPLTVIQIKCSLVIYKRKWGRKIKGFREEKRDKSGRGPFNTILVYLRKEYLWTNCSRKDTVPSNWDAGIGKGTKATEMLNWHRLHCSGFVKKGICGNINKWTSTPVRVKLAVMVLLLRWKLFRSLKKEKSLQTGARSPQAKWVVQSEKQLGSRETAMVEVNYRRLTGEGANKACGYQLEVGILQWATLSCSWSNPWSVCL